LNPKQIITRMTRRDGLAYAFGRFGAVRSMYAHGVKFKQMFGNPAPIGTQPTVFPGVDPERAVADLRRDAVCFGINLTPEMSKTIYDYGVSQPLSHGKVNRPFQYAEVSNGKLPDGQSVAMGYVKDPLACPPVKAVVEDPIMQKVCREYLGYVPPHADVNLYWSFAVNLDLEARRKFNQTVEYHIDVHDFNFCYAHFYITDCDELSGAHVMVRGSHTRKKLGWMFGSARKSDAEVASYYKPEDVLTIKGPAGTGFIEDTSCYHKAIAPVERDRLLFQIRYH
jgi:hypothetical protein